MPEFEETPTNPNPTYSYTPSTSTASQKGGRRRSGGFKSEAVPSNSKIGEVDPAEALKEENVFSQKEPKPSTAASSEAAPNKTSKAKGSKAQPSEATLDSIKRVEEKIAKRRAESEKNRTPRTNKSQNKPQSRAGRKSNPSSDGGILAAITRFFGALLGNSSKETSAVKKGRKPTRRRPQNQNQGNRRGRRENGSGPRRKNHRGGHRNSRNGASKHS